MSSRTPYSAFVVKIIALKPTNAVGVALTPDAPSLEAVLAALPTAVVVVDGDGTIVWANPRAEALVGQRTVVPRQAIAGEAPIESDGRALRVLTLRDAGDVLRQQAAIAELGQRALAGADPRTLMDEAAHCLADILAVDLVEVLELLPGGEQFAARAQVGWEGVPFVAVEGTQVGLTLRQRGPVIVHDTATDGRFSTADLLREEHGVVSGLAVPMIVGDDDLGAVAVHSRRLRSFSEDEVYFVQATANVVASAMQRRMAEQAVEQSAERLRAVMDASPAIIYLKDLHGRLTLANRRFEELFDLEPGSAVGRPNRTLLAPDAAAMVAAHDAAVIAAGAPMEFEERLPIGATGELRIFLSLKFPLRDPGGRIYGVGGVSTDVTERTRAGEERVALEARLARAERLETVGQLAGGIAHDFNNVLAVIASYAGFLRDAVPAGSRAADHVEQILPAPRAAHRLTPRPLLFSPPRARQPEGGGPPPRGAGND